jgi:hypothetical protein
MLQFCSPLTWWIALEDYVVIVGTSVVVWPKSVCACLENDSVILAVAKGSQFVPCVT